MPLFTFFRFRQVFLAPAASDSHETLVWANLQKEYICLWYSQKRYITYQIETYDDTSYLLSSQKSCHTNSNTHYHVYCDLSSSTYCNIPTQNFLIRHIFQTWWFSSSSLAICNLIKSACISISFENIPLAFVILGSLLHCSCK